MPSRNRINLKAVKEHGDRRDAVIWKMRKALEGIDTFAWSMVVLPPGAGENLQARINACRAALKLKTE